MACECEEYLCVEAFINPCSTGVELDIISTYTGNMQGKVWLNGVVTSFAISVESGERIIVPTSLFNENYAHEMRLYANGELIDCYRVKTIMDMDSGTFTPIPATTAPVTYVLMIKMGDPPETLNNVFGTPIEVENGDTIESPLLQGATLISVEQVTEELAPVTGGGVDSFDEETGTITLSQTYTDTFFKIIYKK